MKMTSLLVALCTSLPILAQSSTLSGRVMGHDAKPLAHAQIGVYRFGSDKADTSFDVAASGSYSISFRRPGTYRVQFNGINHEQYVVPFINDRDQREELDVQLANSPLPARIDSVLAIGAFNNFSRTQGTKRMSLKDGAWVVAAPFPSTRFEWQAVVCGDGNGAGQATVACANKAEEFRIRGGHFTALQNVAASPELRFETSVLSPGMTKARITSSNKRYVLFCETFNEMQSYKSSFDETMNVDLGRHRANGGNQANFDMKNFRTKMKVSEQEASVRERMKSTEDSTTLRLLYLYYLSLQVENRDNSLAEKALTVISPSSDVWAIDPQLMYIALSQRSRDSKDSYVGEVITKNRNESVVVPIAYSELIQASVLGEKARQQDLYKTIVERFPNHQLTQAARFYLNPNAAIKAGNTIPAFSYSIAGKDKKLNQDALKGKYTLLDLRTDHCSGCDQAARTLVGLCHDNIKSAVNIIALSLGSQMPEIKEETKGKVTLVSAIFVKDGGSDGATTFEWVGYPWRILIGPDLKILACGNDLNDEHFVATLRSAIK